MTILRSIRAVLDGGPSSRDRALAGRLMRVIFGCYVIVAVGLTAVQMMVAYRAASQRLQDDVAALQRTFTPGIEDAMWRYNAEVLRGILAGMQEIPAVVGVEVRDEAGRRVQATGTFTDEAGAVWPVGRNEEAKLAARPFGTPFSRTFPVVHTDENGRIYPIGSWTVHSDDSIAIEQVKNTLYVILINSAIKSVMLWFIFYLVIRTMVGRPLGQIRDYLARMDADSLGAPPLMIEAGGRNELHALAGALNTMRDRLRWSFEENAALMRDLREMNATLQDRIAERTRDLETLAHTDLLTSLFNRRKLDEALAEATEDRERPLSLILGDIDNFKSVNDRHGHKVGDQVLIAFAGLLRDAVRPTDILGRWGGEEFMLLCPDTDLAAAVALAERLRQRVEETALPEAGTRTCSFGVATLAPGESTDSLVGRADAALYRCKRNGRNRVEVSASLWSETGLKERGAA
ncbi:diguanylate cyclase (GGDEF) domain-containing protein [Methylobacterium sp. ap11]|uniref:GGDEF domain-containing protein n=1 Tax=Methylobacterium sp. ap11 TaxID=1761799 RepID=UPI0008CB52BA|nr:GGDEF domain-containing protein [Methylobacterium sp. ap11]SEP44786.1 diguanylate cyclase (GGDEF) domain-containing protein [Methylobacterium sp. ap11]